jgi:HEXXH motif-containing protein
MLAAVQRHNPAAVNDLLAGPQVGAWTSWCLRRLSRPDDDPGTPLWIDLAHLGAIAAAAAIRCGAEVRVRVPVRDGTVVIPSIGQAALVRTERWSPAECTTGSAGLRFDDVKPVAWQPLRTIHTEAGGVILDAQLDEIDPYWWSFGIPVCDRLSDEDVERWREWTTRAWQAIADHHPHRLNTMAAAIRCLIPVEQGGRMGRVSASSADAAGAIALTEPTNAARLAATLIHESQHFRLNALHDLRPLFREPSRELLYSPWRNDARGLPGVVHGVMAFLGVADFWRHERSDPVADFEYARHVRQLRIAISVTKETSELTSFGKAVSESLGTAIAALPMNTMSAEVDRLADDLVSEHQAWWRLANVVPHPDAVSKAVVMWQNGEPLRCDRGSTPVRSAPSGDNPLTRLAMACLENPTELRALPEHERAARFPGTTALHLLLLNGDYAAGREAALTRIHDGESGDRDWAVLSVTHARRCQRPEESPFVTHPELVRAAWRRVAATRPGALTALLDTYETGTSIPDSTRR